MEFLCPNGHKIHCPNEQAGRAAKCPRCGVKFLIPTTTSGVPEAPPQIEFLCPAGDRLHGPARLQGRPGECPECGSKFRIPTYDEVGDDEKMEPDISLGGVDPPSVAPSQIKEIEESFDSADSAEGFGVRQVALELPSTESGRKDLRHPLAALFSKLWAERPPGGAVELHLDHGETLVPGHFAETLSQQSHGVFAVEEPDGTHTLTVVAWDSVVRVLVRGVCELPTEMDG